MIVREGNKPNIPDVGDSQYVDKPDKYTITLLDWQKKSLLTCLFTQVQVLHIKQVYPQ